MSATHVDILQTGAGGNNPVAMPGATFAKGDCNVANNLNVQGTINLLNATTGAVSAYVVETTGNANGQVAKAKEAAVNPGTGAALANATTYTYTVAFGRAGTLTQITIGAKTVPTTAGSCVVTIKNKGTTNLLSGTNFDLTTLTGSDVASQPALATAASLVLAATDVIEVIVTTLTQGTACLAPVITLEMLPTDY